MKKHIDNFKTFESSGQKPTKKFPTDKAVHYQYLVKILRDNNIDPYEIGGDSKHSFHKFINAKCINTGDFPNNSISSIYNNSDTRDYIDGETIILFPQKYDSKNDQSDFVTKKLSFLNRMRDMYKGRMTEEELDQMEKDLEKHVNFGTEGYEWINPILEIIYKKLSNFYVNGQLRVWYPKDHDYDIWETSDYPHKYNVIGHLTRPNGVYYLSDIEKYIEKKYGISDEKFYEYIIHNEYIEGRYWERVWSLRVDSKDKTKLARGGGEYGMEPTENIEHMLNIIQKDFADEIKGDDYEGFPIYIDYYKKVDAKY